jgi:hypothetical protein
MSEPRSPMRQRWLVLLLGAMLTTVLAADTLSQGRIEEASEIVGRPVLDDPDEARPPDGQVLARIERRLAELDAREAEIGDREQAVVAMLADMEVRIGRILGEMETRCAAQTAENTPSPSSDEDVTRLSARVRAMSPERAAALLQELPTEFAARVLVRIGARDGGRILDSLPAATAAEIGRHIAAPREAP